MRQSFTFEKLTKLNMIIIITFVGSLFIGLSIKRFTDSDAYSVFDLLLGIAGLIGLVTIPVWVLGFLLSRDREVMRQTFTFENLSKLIPILIMGFVGSAFIGVFIIALNDGESTLSDVVLLVGGIAGLILFIAIPLWVIVYLSRIFRSSPPKQYPQSPFNILQQSYNKGEISHEEYDIRLRVLQGNNPTQGYNLQPQYYPNPVQQPPNSSVAQPSAVEICRNCEAQNPLNNSYCSNCGAPFS